MVDPLVDPWVNPKVDPKSLYNINYYDIKVNDKFWRRVPESNRCTRICNGMHLFNLLLIYNYFRNLCSVYENV